MTQPTPPAADRLINAGVVLAIIAQLIAIGGVVASLFALAAPLIAIVASLLSSAASAKVPIVPRGQHFTCTAIAVWDGDGPIWCAEGPRVRLYAIAARERDGSCRPGQPCPAASGITARDKLVELLGGSRGLTADGHVIVAGPAMDCASQGPDRYGRTVASCSLHDGDLSHRLVSQGVALPWHGSFAR